MAYIMDTPQEGDRIELKTDRALTEMQLAWGGVHAGAAVLDLGCAAGTISRMMAERVGPSGVVIAVDGSAERLEQGRRHPDHRPWIDYRRGDAAALPVADASVDVAWSRFVFEYLPRPAAALGEMIRATRPGGAVIVSDLDGNCVWHAPEDPILKAEIEDVLATLGLGFDPHIGRRLYALFLDAGLEDIEVDIRPYHQIIGRIDPEQEAHWLMKVRGVCAAVRGAGWEEARARSLEERFMDYLRDPRTLTYSVLFTVRGRVR